MSVAGFAGLLIGCPDPAHVREWYRRHLGLRFSAGEGARFTWRDVDSGRSSDTRLDFVDEASQRLNPGTPPVVVRYLVRDLEALAETLPEGGDGLTMREGRCGWMIDPDGRRVERCEAAAASEPPVDHGRVTGIGGVNLRVQDLDGLVASLRGGGGGVWVDPNTEAYEYGKFAWIVDPTGARVELWEPAPAAS
ncbi:VOC family protein [Candidatus Palauibacter sp.]|uniref:VOC family protein n=1 Tax=Candidatus Palauibacter sp. TaxID=3101350 RepID=UPI003AF28742